MVRKIKVYTNYSNREVKKVPKIDPTMLKYKIVSRTLISNTERQ